MTISKMAKKVQKAQTGGEIDIELVLVEVDGMRLAVGKRVVDLDACIIIGGSIVDDDRDAEMLQPSAR